MRKLILALMLMLFGMSCVQAASRTFTVQGGRLVDASGRPFIIRGINNPHIWFGEKAFRALDDIRAIGANTVRIVWETRGAVDDLERVVRRCIDLQMIPMVELHDATGSPSAERLADMARWYAVPAVSAMLRRYEKYLLLNIANEWGNHTVRTAQWLEGYRAAVAILRDAGYRTTLVVDASGYGQDMTPVLEGGRDLLAADPLHNLLFSVHMYGSWNDAEKIVSQLSEAVRLELPLIVGEFGYNFREGRNNLGCRVDYAAILESCNQLGLGFMPWSWTGNNEENAWLDLVDSRDWKTPTAWGASVLLGPGGIAQTAQTARVFGRASVRMKRNKSLKSQ
ncbi:MAG: glycoside hydrolase family 5 protein [Bacteroidales bacterium]|nr:glycoside hydrolase family 5 protein [Bacteroidales bacterium]